MLESFVILALTLEWFTPLGKDCLSWPNHRADRVLTSCRSDEGLRLMLIDRDGRKITIDDIDSEIARNGVGSGPASWAPSDAFAALEIGLDEEPGVLLIDTSDTPSAVFVDRLLNEYNVSGADPLWDSSGKWLVFRTSGTGDRSNEGVYALRIKDRVLFRLVSAVPRAIRLTDDTLYVTRTKPKDGETEVLKFKFSKLIAHRKRIGVLTSR